MVMRGLLELNFVIFGVISVIASLCMISSSNAVHAALYLIIIYIAIVAIFLMLGIEFLPILLIVVYVGAIAILFLFVVMMINIEEQEVRESIYDYTIMGVLLIYVLLLEFGFIFSNIVVGLYNKENISYITLGLNYISNIEVIGQILFIEYRIEFFIAGLVLLMAMLAAIVITIYHRKSLKRQNTYKQLGRYYLETVVLKNFK